MNFAESFQVHYRCPSHKVAQQQCSSRPKCIGRLAKVVPHPGSHKARPSTRTMVSTRTASAWYHMAIGERRDELRTSCAITAPSCKITGAVLTALWHPRSPEARHASAQVYSSMNDLGTFLSAVADLYDSLAMTHAHALHVGRHQKILNATARMCQFTNRARRLAGALTVASLVSSYIAGIAAIARDGDLKVSGIEVCKHHWRNAWDPPGSTAHCPHAATCRRTAV